MSAPTTLLDAQRWLADIVLGGRAAVDAHLGDADSRLKGPSRDDARARLGAYVAGYPARIREALTEAYPAIENLVGDVAFMALAERYAPHSPTGQYSLTSAAGALQAFLDDDELTDSLPFLPQLADLEWHVLEAFHATDRVAADLSVVSGWGPEDWAAAVLEFQPSVWVSASEWPLHDLWTARDTERDEIDIVVEGRPQAVMVYRSGPFDSIDASVRCVMIEPLRAEALSRLIGGASLGETMTALAEASISPEQVSGWFAQWAEDALITSIGRAASAE